MDVFDDLLALLDCVVGFFHLAPLDLCAAVLLGLEPFSLLVVPFSLALQVSAGSFYGHNFAGLVGMACWRLHVQKVVM